MDDVLLESVEGGFHTWEPNHIKILTPCSLNCVQPAKVELGIIQRGLPSLRSSLLDSLEAAQVRGIYPLVLLEMDLRPALLELIHFH